MINDLPEPVKNTTAYLADGANRTTLSTSRKAADRTCAEREELRQPSACRLPFEDLGCDPRLAARGEQPGAGRGGHRPGHLVQPPAEPQPRGAGRGRGRLHPLGEPEFAEQRPGLAVRPAAHRSSHRSSRRRSSRLRASANVAPWNLADHPVRPDGDRLRVGASPLLFFHFHGFRHLVGRLYDPNLAKYGARLSESARRHVYHPYIRALREADRELAPHSGSIPLGTSVRHPLPTPFVQRVVKRIRRLGRFWIGLASGHYLLAPRPGTSKRRVSGSASVPARS